ncbi:MAG: acyltransferase family protein [Alphaproteobacteria bacterium]|nr:acyltransferase family protein [Alphaproteobacteria bacterium]
MLNQSLASPATASRVDWVDIAKGVCIILVVMLHATQGVEKAMGEASLFGAVIDWAKPFRMPDFFLISGLFLARRIDRPWRSYLDTKVLHFAYFYILWVNIQIGIKAPHFIGELGLAGFAKLYLTSYVIPVSSLWFIYLLAVYFVAAKLLSGISKPLVFLAAAAMHGVTPESGVFVVDQFSERFVFFYAGYAAAPVIFDYARRVARAPELLVGAALATWCILNAWAVSSGLAETPALDLAVSFIGIGAVIAFSVVLLDTPVGKGLAYCGRQSISIYLAFAIPMAAMRQILLKLDLGLGVDAISLAALTAGVIAPLILAAIVKPTPLAFLFTRPDAFRLKDARAKLGQRANQRLDEIGKDTRQASPTLA